MRTNRTRDPRKEVKNGKILIIGRKKKRNTIGTEKKRNYWHLLVKWSGGVNRRLRDTDWLGYTSILSFFLSLPSLFPCSFTTFRRETKLNFNSFNFNIFFTFFCISNTKHTHVEWDTIHRTLSFACVVHMWGFG